MERGWTRVDEGGGRCIIVQPGAHYFRDRIVDAASIPLMSNGRSNNDFAGFRNRPREQRCVGSNRLARTLHPANLDDHRQHTGVDKICITFRDVASPCKPINVRARVASRPIAETETEIGDEARSFLDPRDLRVPALLRIPKLPINWVQRVESRRRGGTLRFVRSYEI